SCPPLGSRADIRLVEGFSELAHSLLLLPRQFYGTTLPCFGLYPLEKTGIARYMPGILLEEKGCNDFEYK
ncbi:MAG: hypothetical protein PUA91_05590, partial [Desulfovibrio piger]